MHLCMTRQENSVKRTRDIFERSMIERRFGESRSLYRCGETYLYYFGRMFNTQEESKVSVSDVLLLPLRENVFH